MTKAEGGGECSQVRQRLDHAMEFGFFCLQQGATGGLDFDARERHDVISILENALGLDSRETRRRLMQCQQLGQGW